MDWSHYALAPTVRAFLGYEPRQGGESLAEDVEARFEAFFLQHLEASEPLEFAMVAELLVELTAMKLPRLVMELYDHYTAFDFTEDFRVMLSLGSACMLEMELDEATAFATKAHQLAPEELAPYVNLANIYFFQHDDARALHWAEQGLELSPNDHRLWEIFASCQEGEQKQWGEAVKAKAMQLRSFAGCSLAAELLEPGEPLFRLQLLEDHYDSGGREPEFLVEYTALLGLNNRYQELGQVLWEVENLPDYQGQVPWQVYLHVCQGFLAAEAKDQAKAVLTKLQKQQDIPESGLAGIEALAQEIEASP